MEESYYGVVDERGHFKLVKNSNGACLESRGKRSLYCDKALLIKIMWNLDVPVPLVENELTRQELINELSANLRLDREQCKDLHQWSAERLQYWHWCSDQTKVVLSDFIESGMRELNLVY